MFGQLFWAILSPFKTRLSFLGSLATNQTQPFTAAFLDSPKEAHEKEDVLFEALTEGVTIDEFMAALELVSTVRRQLIEKEQFL